MSRSNTSGDTPELYYKRTISIAFLDEITVHLQSCFANIQQKATAGMRIVPSVIKDNSLLTSQVDQLKEFYEDDLPNPSSLETEVHLWKCKWCSFSQTLPDTPADALLLASKNMLLAFIVYYV